MSSAVASTDGANQEAGAAKKGGKKKLVLIAVPLLLLVLGAGLWFSGILPGMLGMKKTAEQQTGEHEKGKRKRAYAAGLRRSARNGCEP